jgi:hypothetical protein
VNILRSLFPAIVVAAVGLSLSGCEVMPVPSSQPQWVNPTLPQGTWEGEQFACASAASFEVREINRYSLSGQDQVRLDSASETERDRFEQCMARKGFTKRRG